MKATQTVLECSAGTMNFEQLKRKNVPSNTFVFNKDSLFYIDLEIKHESTLKVLKDKKYCAELSLKMVLPFAKKLNRECWKLLVHNTGINTFLLIRLR